MSLGELGLLSSASELRARQHLVWRFLGRGQDALGAQVVSSLWFWWKVPSPVCGLWHRRPGTGTCGRVCAGECSYHSLLLLVEPFLYLRVAFLEIQVHTPYRLPSPREQD